MLPYPHGSEPVVILQVDVAGIDGWVPLRVDLTGDALVADIRDRIPNHDPSTWHLLASLADRGQSEGTETPPLLATWARIPNPDQIVPDTLARLSLVPAAPEATAQDVAESLFDGSELHRPISYTTLNTESGESTAFEALTLANEADGSTFTATYGVIWVGFASGEALLLTASTVDLVGGNAWRPEFLQLASGVAGY